jgi:hypothetical protein
MTDADNANDAVPILLTIGGIFLIGLFADLLGRRTPLPRVTLLLLAAPVRRTPECALRC